MRPRRSHRPGDLVGSAGFMEFSGLGAPQSPGHGIVCRNRSTAERRRRGACAPGPPFRAACSWALRR